MTQVNDGRGWPEAEEPAPVAIAPHRSLLFAVIEGALRAEHGVRMRQAQRGKTDYYSGRRAGFIASAAMLVQELYSGDYDRAKDALSQGIRFAGDAVSTEDLVDPVTARALATTIAEKVLRVI